MIRCKVRWSVLIDGIRSLEGWALWDSAAKAGSGLGLALLLFSIAAPCRACDLRELTIHQSAGERS